MELIPPTPAAQRPHTGLLRDETLVLRYLFGYSSTEISDLLLPFSTVEVLSKTGIRDVRFLGIDIDAIQEQDQIIKQFHMGISILDTQSLHDLALGLAEATPTVITSHHFVVGDSNFRSGASKMFLFGQFETISLKELKAKIEAMTLNRIIIPVCHGSDRELRVLQTLNINLRPAFILDTVKAAQFPLQLSYRYSLKRLLDEFNIPNRKLHSSGNDAHFVLRALLMIVVRDVELLLDVSTFPCWLPIFKEVAQSPLNFIPSQDEGDRT